MSEQLFLAYKGKHLEVSDARLEYWQTIYNNVDVRRELEMMDNWLEANPRRRKRNNLRFIVNWLNHEWRKAAASRREALVGANPFTDVKVRPEAIRRAQERK